MKQTTYTDAKVLNQQFSKRIAGLLQEGIDNHGQASLIVSGGRTPQGLFACLSEAELDWSKVVVSLADERWVPATDDASNEKMVREHLLKGKAARAQFVGLKNAATEAQQGVAECVANLRQIPQPFDVLILGMGEDGHTASLFPCSKQIGQGLDMDYPRPYLAVQPATAPNWRMSLSLAALLNSKHIFLHLTGDAKRAVLDKALAGEDEFEMPIRAVLKRAEVELVWAP